jgi:hypothetical protein
MSAIRGQAAADQTEWGGDVDQRERQIASVLQNVWFASFVGWAGGLHDASRVLEDVNMAIELLFEK